MSLMQPVQGRKYAADRNHYRHYGEGAKTAAMGERAPQKASSTRRAGALMLILILWRWG